ncbi:unnamed protein product [Arctogadus glacialis]
MLAAAYCAFDFDSRISRRSVTISVYTHPEVVTSDSDEDAIPPSPAISRRSSRIQPKLASWASWPTKKRLELLEQEGVPVEVGLSRADALQLADTALGEHLHAPTFAPDAAAAGSAAATSTKPGKKHAGRPATSGLGKRARKAVHFGPRDPQQHPQQVPDADLRQVLQTLAESVQSISARMDAVETPGGTPGRVQAPNPLSSAATAPFFLQQPSGSVPSAFTGYAPGTCLATMATASPALAPVTYSLSTALPAQLQGAECPRQGGN